MKWEWGKNPHIDQFGEFVDVDTECNGKPCNYPEEIVPYSSEELSGPFCVPADNDQVICNYLPQNATLVSESEFDRIFPGSSYSIPDSPQPPKLLASSNGSGPEPSQVSQVSSTSKGSVPRPSQTSQVSSASKRSVPQASQTSQLFSVSKRSIPKPSQASHPCLASNETLPKHAEPLNALKTEKLKVTAAVSNAIQYWENQCGVPGIEFFQHWSYLDNASSSPEANIWFYFVKGVVCNKPAAFACAFFPQDYGKRTAVYVNWDKFKGRSSKGIAMIMAHEIGHVLGLAHENIDKTDKGDWAKVWKVSPYDKDSVMHSYYDISKELTKTYCRTMSFYNNGFKDLKCGLVGGTVMRCKNYRRNVVKPKDVELRTNEVLIDTGSGSAAHLEDVADYTCLGSDMSKYILNEPLISESKLGYVKLGFALTQCLGIQVPSDPDHAYVMQSDGNFVSYNTKTGQAVWSTQSQGHGTKGDYSILFQNDGNLVIYDKKGTPTWGSRSFHGGPDAFRVKALF
ncbi:hypothetical protein EC957_005601 [Mortierella hygrophila]|uniref:Bulb-type lectin domain-containing protein n=1 Tax=Mortierella hygrophila TaxID=979708 RepID=A0A9P6JZ31_9FUNG|nr:hypothetical protein EC957_005601 [Mortierella hygrophila]